MADLASRLALVVDFAPRLRAAGVQSLTLGDLTLALLPHEAAELAAAPVDEGEEPASPLDDPDTYGLPEGSTVPGFTRPNDLPRKGES